MPLMIYSDVTTNEYMGFGLSGLTDRTLMLGADATIAYVDDDTGPTAVDYHLSGYVQVARHKILDLNAITSIMSGGGALVLLSPCPAHAATVKFCSA